MDPTLVPIVSALCGALAGGLTTLIAQGLNFRAQLELSRRRETTEYMAEETVRALLAHRRNLEHDFDVIKGKIGGFEDDELRRILVRAGARRRYRRDGRESWMLMSRMDEFIARRRRRPVRRS